MKLEITLGDKNNIEVSDWYHTFNELYEHRIALFIALCRIIKDNNYYIDIINDKCETANPKHFTIKRSKLHFDWTSFEWMFIVQLITPYWQVSYHLDDKYWDKCGFMDTFDKADKRDWHTSEDVINRLLSI